MRKLMIVPVAALIALTGCGGSEEANVAAPADANEATMIGNDGTPVNALERVLAMTDRQRNATFVRAILDANLPCDGVTKSERLPDQNGKPVWRVDCKGENNSHIVSVTPDGTVTINSRN